MTTKRRHGEKAHPKPAEDALRGARDEIEASVRERTTELAEANRRTEQLVAELRQANEAKDEFLGLLSHELRTSVTLLYGGVKALRRMAGRLNEDDAQELLATAELEADSLYRTVEDLLNLARLELGEWEPAEPVLLQHVIPRFMRGFSRNRPRRPIIVNVPAELEPVLAEPTYVEQVLRNLVSNAEKYSPEESPIEVRASSDGRHEVTVSVLDRGPGVSEEEQKLVFERFYRANDSAKRVRGMGMGLTVCKRLVEAQSGRIWLAPREGGGLEVSFALPVAKDGLEGD